MRLLVCAGRNFQDVAYLWSVLDRFHRKFIVHVLIEGASDDVTGPYIGGDYWANQWALARKIQPVRCHANWRGLGRRAGPERNEHMLNAERPDCVVGFPGGNGTENMMSLADKAGVPVFDIRAKKWRSKQYNSQVGQNQ